MIYLILGWCTGYLWCRIWRTGRPEKTSLVSLIAGYLIGRHHDRSQ